MLAPKVSRSWVCLYSWLSTTLATASLDRMISRRIVSPLDWSMMSEIPDILPCLCRSTILASRLSGLTW